MFQLVHLMGQQSPRNTQQSMVASASEKVHVHALYAKIQAPKKRPSSMETKVNFVVAHVRNDFSITEAVINRNSGFTEADDPSVN